MTQAAATKTPTPQSWRTIYPVHPCADVFPMMSTAEIDELAKDIKAHGLQKPIVVWRSGPEQSWQVLDGRNRLEALTRLGVALPRIANGNSPEVRLPNGGVRRDIFTLKYDEKIEPAAYVISANIRRRHLTKEEQAALIVKTIEASQPKTDRATVARSVKRGANGRVVGSTKDPVLEQAVNEAQKHGISKRTMQNARAKLQGKSKAPRKPRNQKLPDLGRTQTKVVVDLPPRREESPPSVGTATTPPPLGRTQAVAVDDPSVEISGLAEDLVDDLRTPVTTFVADVVRPLAKVHEKCDRFSVVDRQAITAILKDARDRIGTLCDQFDDALTALAQKARTA